MRSHKLLSPFASSLTRSRKKLHRDKPLAARLVVESLEDRSLLSTGVVITDLGASSTARGSLLDGNDNLVIAGVVTDADRVTNVLTARYGPDGILDSDYGSAGLVTTDVLHGYYSSGKVVAATPDGKLVVGGHVPEKSRGASTSGSSDFAIIRYNADGSLDTTFGSSTQGNTAGIVRLDLGGNDRFEDLIVLDDGSIIVAGDSNYGGSGSHFTLAKLTSSGQLDTTFGTNGATQTVLGRWSVVYGLTLHQGKILAVGRTDSADWNTDFALARYELNGQLDPSFGNGGTVVMHLSPHSSGTGGDSARAVVIDATDRILVGGHSSVDGGPGYIGDYVVARFNATGTIDPTFGTNGVSHLLFPSSDNLGTSGEVDAIALQPDGRIIVSADMLGGRQEFQLARLLPDGSLDTTFDGDGRVVTTIGTSATVRSLAIQSDGKIVAVGYSSNGSYNSITLARYNPDGSLDTTFGELPPGITVTPTSGLQTTESGGTAQFSVVLNTQPTADVTIAMSSSDTTEGTVSATSLTFTPANWNTPQTVTITGVDDSIKDGTVAYSIVTGPAVSADSAYSGIDPADVSVTNKDNEKGGKNHLAASVPGDHRMAASITGAEAQPLLVEALRRFLLSGESIAGLGKVRIVVTDLPGATLGMAVGDTILLDRDAAGWGWFVDSTPRDDAEFVSRGDQGEQEHMDLLSVVMHEVGHLLGHDHDDGGLMAETLAAGRRTATPGDAAADLAWGLVHDLLKPRDAAPRWL